ncbi:MBL fold metallo-hydrolase [Candidatus Bathyarchaeota archaeon]|nr:MBL fold metallo-hydrolase [Candidatus Bathyarchaeota archaeon]
MILKFHGGAREVGGSCVGVETECCKVALDYGAKIDKENHRDLPKDLDAVIISHAHLDHSGSLLKLSKRKPVIIGSKMTQKVTIELLLDMIKIQNQKNKITSFSNHDAEIIRRNWWCRNSTALPGMTIKLYPAGHVAGAKIIHIQSDGKQIIYTGDFCVHGTEILDGCKIEQLPKNPDVLITESTYGGTIRENRNKLIERFFEKVGNTIDRKGNVLIPTFAFHRSQEMCKRIDQAMKKGIIPKYKVYTISNLARKIEGFFNENKEYFTKEIQQQEKPFKYKNVKHIFRLSQIKKPAIVIATSGFGHAGASLNLLANWASEPNNSIIITSGYLPPESPLNQAKEKREFEYKGDIIKTEADVEQIELSGHADQKELIKFIESLKPKNTVLMHGELDQAEMLARKISQITEVAIPEKDEILDF